jgi:hypothetical protein
MLNELYGWNFFWEKRTKHLVGHVVMDINVKIRIMLRYSTAQIIMLVAMVIKLLNDSIAQMNVLVASDSPQ